MWQVKFHYASAITPFIFIAAIFGTGILVRLLCHPELVSGSTRFGASRFRNKFGMTEGRIYVLLGVYLVAISLFWNYMHSPSPLYREFDPSVFKVSSEAHQTREILKQIPQDASVSAMNNLGAHLSTRRYLYRFPIGIGKADYIVVDPEMPGENFDYAQTSEEDFEDLMGSSEIVNRYQKVVESERLLILKRKEP